MLENTFKDPEKWFDLGSFVRSLVGSGQVGPGNSRICFPTEGSKCQLASEQRSSWSGCTDAPVELGHRETMVRAGSLLGADPGLSQTQKKGFLRPYPSHRLGTPQQVFPLPFLPEAQKNLHVFPRDPVLLKILVPGELDKKNLTTHRRLSILGTRCLGSLSV